MLHFTSRKRRRLLETDLAATVAELGEICPLSPDEITKWASCLGEAGVDGERRLKNLVTYWYAQASSLFRVTQETDAARVREFIRHPLEQGVSRDAIDLPKHFERVDKWLPELANRLSAIRTELARPAWRRRLGTSHPLRRV